MKAFEEWFDNQKIQEPPYGNIDSARVSWRAALKQVLKWMVSGEVFPEDVDILIERELEDN